MMRTGTIDIEPGHRRIVLDILRTLLPPGTRTWVFGSRAIGGARKYSDLDLAIDAGRPLTLDETARLREAFAESDLPYGVDIVDWQTVSDEFRRIIGGGRRPFAKARVEDADPR